MTKNCNIKQYVKQITRAQLDAAEDAIILLPDPASRAWPDFPYIEVIKSRLGRTTDKRKLTGPLLLDLPNQAGTHVSVGAIGKHMDRFERLGLMRQLVAAHTDSNARQLTIIVVGSLNDALDDLISAILVARYALPDYKSKKDPRASIDKVQIYGLKKARDFTRVLATCDGNNLARELTVLPPNALTPAIYRKRIAKIARANGWKMEFLGEAQLKRKKAGAFLAVAQGSSVADAGIVRLRYMPQTPKTPKKKSSKKSVALVGKGICFDTGGMNLKPAKYMQGMHEDMQGSAVALGTLLALTRMKVDFPVEAWLALAQNHIGPDAYKQNDVVTAANGTSIEIMHTDAEGRMVLADTLTLASRSKPGLMLDYATLTGACVYSLSSRYSGAFTNRDKFIQPIIAAGRASGERVWPFPTDADFDKELDSKIADIRQCTLGGEADHILAARFLGKFIEHDTPWIHIDLSASNHKGGLAHIPTDTTGFGVGFSLSLLLEQKLV